MYTINNSGIINPKKNIFIKGKGLNFISFPKIHILQNQQTISNNFKDIKSLKKYNQNSRKNKNNSANLINRYNRKILSFQSRFGDNIFNLINKNKNNTRNIISNHNMSILENLNNMANYKYLAQIWDEFDISESYINLFNILLNRLSEKEKEEICIKEFKELSELKNNIISIIKEIDLRKSSLKKLFKLNNISNEDSVSESNDKIINEISEQIGNLRLHSVNICFKMKKIKNKIYEGYLYGKFDLDTIAKKFGFDKDYLIKMKEEMNFFKDGKIKLYFNIGSNPDPFLTKASDNLHNSNKNNTSFFLVPISREMSESIKQCNYFIYQELIYFQSNNNRINNFLSYRGENITKNTFYEQLNNHSLFEEENNRKIDEDSNKYQENIINNQENNYEFNSGKRSSERIEILERKNLKRKNESNIFKENQINLNEIIGEKIINKNNLNKQKRSSKTSDRKSEKLSESQISKISYQMSNETKRGKILNTYSNKNFEVFIYEGYIHYFEEKFYFEYFKQIPEQQIKMFNLRDKITTHMDNGISPFLLLVKEENFNNNIYNNQIQENEQIYGCCLFNYIQHRHKLKIKINHISAIADYNYPDYIDNLKLLYSTIINYIINEFPFNQIIIEFSKKNLNKELYTIFKELNFLEKTESIKKNKIKSKKGESSSNNEKIKLYYLVYKNKNDLDDFAIKSFSSFHGNNLFNFLNLILLCNSDKEVDTNIYQNVEISPKDINEINNLKYKNSEIFVNMTAINSLFQSDKKTNISELYQRITSLDKLMKIFLINKIDKNEIPLSIAQNIFKILGFILDNIINSILINSSKLINNYNYFTADSFLDSNSGFYYNFMKPALIYELSDESIEINCYIIVKESFAVAFIKFEDNMIYEEILNKKNIYKQVKDIFEDLINNKNIKILKDKMIWIPCFHSYKHLKCLINNSYFTVHEYIQVTNKIIKTNKRKRKEKPYEFLFKNNTKSFLIEPEVTNDIIINNNFIIAIINKAEYFNKYNNNKNHTSIENKERIASGNESKNKGDIANNNQEKKELISENKENKQENKEENKKSNSEEFPNIIFLNYIRKSDFLKT